MARVRVRACVGRRPREARTGVACESLTSRWRNFRGRSAQKHIRSAGGATCPRSSRYSSRRHKTSLKSAHSSVANRNATGLQSPYHRLDDITLLRPLSLLSSSSSSNALISHLRVDPTSASAVAACATCPRRTSATPIPMIRATHALYTSAGAARTRATPYSATNSPTSSHGARCVTHRRFGLCLLACSVTLRLNSMCTLVSLVGGFLT